MAAPHPALVGLIRGEDFPSGLRVTMPLVASAVDHRIGPLLDEAVREQGIGGDRDALTQLAMLSLESTADTRAAMEALSTLLDTCESLGINVAIFKGLAIGGRWYARPELRPAHDIDVFVDPAQIGLIADLVSAFDPTPGSGQTIAAMVAEDRVFEHAVSVDGFDVDIHRDPMNLVLASRQQELIWRHTEPLCLTDSPVVRTLNLELSIVQALLHLFRDNFANLLHVYDIALMMDDSPDWDVIESFVDREGWTDMIRFALTFVCGVLDRPSPLSGEISSTSRALISMIWSRDMFLDGFASIATSPRRQTLLSLLISGRRLELVRPMARRVLPARSIIEQRSTTGVEPTVPYAVALYRWRRSQRDGIKRFRSDVATARTHKSETE